MIFGDSRDIEHLTRDGCNDKSGILGDRKGTTP
jgi:hypothetical protein